MTGLAKTNFDFMPTNRMASVPAHPSMHTRAQTIFATNDLNVISYREKMMEHHYFGNGSSSGSINGTDSVQDCPF